MLLVGPSRTDRARGRGARGANGRRRSRQPDDRLPDLAIEVRAGASGRATADCSSCATSPPRRADQPWSPAGGHGSTTTACHLTAWPSHHPPSTSRVSCLRRPTGRPRPGRCRSRRRTPPARRTGTRPSCVRVFDHCRGLAHPTDPGDGKHHRGAVRARGAVGRCGQRVLAADAIRQLRRDRPPPPYCGLDRPGGAQAGPGGGTRQPRWGPRRMASDLAPGVDRAKPTDHAQALEPTRPVGALHAVYYR